MMLSYIHNQIRNCITLPTPKRKEMTNLYISKLLGKLKIFETKLPKSNELSTRDAKSLKFYCEVLLSCSLPRFAGIVQVPFKNGGFTHRHHVNKTEVHFTKLLNSIRSRK